MTWHRIKPPFYHRSQSWLVAELRDGNHGDGKRLAGVWELPSGEFEWRTFADHGSPENPAETGFTDRIGKAFSNVAGSLKRMARMGLVNLPNGCRIPGAVRGAA